MSRELLRQLNELDNDDEIRAIIITGTDGYFSVGIDIHELAEIQNYSQVTGCHACLNCFFVHWA
jgi:enoyl-CoA hydratase/carnithine racemase